MRGRAVVRRNKRPIWSLSPFARGCAAGLAATCLVVAGSTLVSPSVVAASMPAEVSRPSAPAARTPQLNVVLASTARATRPAVAIPADAVPARETPKQPADAVPARDTPAAVSASASPAVGKPRSGLAGIFDEPTVALAHAPPPVELSAEEEAADWAHQVATVVGDDLTAVETGCIGAAARKGLRDDPSLWGPAISGDLAALRPFGDRVARGCGVEPARLAPVVTRALAQWGPTPGSRLMGMPLS